MSIVEIRHSSFILARNVGFLFPVQAESFQHIHDGKDCLVQAYTGTGKTLAFSIPIVVLMVLPKLQEMNDSMIDAARDLGANNFQVIKNIILPFLTPGIIAGYFMAFTYSLDDFAVTFFVTGNGFSTLSVEIYSRARQGISLEINALSTLVFLFSMILVVGYYFISKENGAKKLRKNRRVEVANLR